MVRHMSFKKGGEFFSYVAASVPRHVYYSSAYYRKPSHKVMKEKGWLGADLIFDLDADHIKDSKVLTYPEMLEKVKEEYKKLVDFITTDFGFEMKHLEMVFSGGRGYHLHVRSPKVLELGSEERREMVDYITGRGLEPEIFVPKKPYKRLDYKNFPSKIKEHRELKKNGGWGKRIYKAVLKFADELERIEDEKKRIEYIKERGKIGEKRARRILERLFSGKEGKRGIDLLKKGKVDIFKGRKDVTEIFSNLVTEYAVQISVSGTDEPVTGDVHRLIRVPGSLHGKTGLRVTPLSSLEDLENFHPLSDAVVFSDKDVKVRALKDGKVFLKDEEFILKKDEIISLPEYASVFVLGIGLGEIAN